MNGLNIKFITTNEFTSLIYNYNGLFQYKKDIGAKYKNHPAYEYVGSRLNIHYIINKNFTENSKLSA